MAGRHPTLNHSQRGQAPTTSNTSLGLGFRSAAAVVRYHFLFLAPLIVYSMPAKIALGVSSVIVLVIIVVGLSGVFARRQVLITLTSLMLLASLIAGKVGADLVNAASPDTALLLLQFVAIVFFMESSRVVMSYDNQANELGRRDDVMSREFVEMRHRWLRSQLRGQFRLVAGAVTLSLVLLVIGGFASLTVGQLAFSSIFVLLVIGALLFLIIQRREPETVPRS